MKRYVMDEWGDGDSVDVVEIEPGEQIVVRSHEEPPREERTIRLTLWTSDGVQGSAPIQIWHCTSPLGLRAEVAANVSMIEVEWL